MEECFLDLILFKIRDILFGFLAGENCVLAGMVYSNF